MNATPASRRKGGWGGGGRGCELRGSLRSPAGATFNGKSKETSVCMEHMSWLRAVGAAAAWMPLARGWEVSRAGGGMAAAHLSACYPTIY